MTTIGSRIDENGTLIRDGGAFYLRRDRGGQYQKELQRVPVDLVEKRVRLVRPWFPSTSSLWPE